MKKRSRSTRKSSAMDFLSTPPAATSAASPERVLQSHSSSILRRPKLVQFPDGYAMCCVIQTHGSQQVADEVEREYKKMSQRINEGSEAMKGSYSTFMAELQASGARLCKQTLPKLSQSVEKAIFTLRNRYGIHSTSAC